MKKLYSEQVASAWRKKAVLWLWVLCALMAGMLAVNIYLCSRVNTRNADQMLLWVVLLSVAAGWAALIFFVFAYRPARARADHMLGILSGERETAAGVLMRRKERFAIPKSVTVQKIALIQGEEALLLHADTAIARQLPPDGTRVTVETVRKFITGYEVMHK